MQKSIFLILSFILVLIIPLIILAANEVTLDANTNFSLITTDTATTTTIIGLSGGTVASLTAETNYLDITMENGSSISFDSNSNFTFSVRKQSGSDNYNVSKSCPTNAKSRVTLVATGSVVLRLQVASTLACGQGGPLIYSLPTPPAKGFSVVINSDASETDSRIVTLTLSGGPDTIRMAISNSSDFTIQETYQETKTWILTEGEGEKTVYVKFYNRLGLSSEVVSDTIIFTTAPPSPLSPEAQKVDTNKDDKIDVLDFNSLMLNWGATIAGNIADFNADDKVDILDFNLLIIHWTL